MATVRLPRQIIEAACAEVERKCGELIKLSIDMRGACPMPTGELARRVDGCMFPEDGSCCWWAEFE